MPRPSEMPDPAAQGAVPHDRGEHPVPGAKPAARPDTGRSPMMADRGLDLPPAQPVLPDGLDDLVHARRAFGHQLGVYREVQDRLNSDAALVHEVPPVDAASIAWNVGLGELVDEVRAAHDAHVETYANRV